MSAENSVSEGVAEEVEEGQRSGSVDAAGLKEAAGD